MTDIFNPEFNQTEKEIMRIAGDYVDDILSESNYYINMCGIPFEDICHRIIKGVVNRCGQRIKEYKNSEKE